MRRTGPSIIPGGRIIAPPGQEFPTGGGAFGAAVNASGRTVITVNSEPGWSSLTVVERSRSGEWQSKQFDLQPSERPESGGNNGEEWRSLLMGPAFFGEKAVFASEGASGKVTLFEWNSGRRRPIDLNQKGYTGSYTGDITLDAVRGVVYVVDQANSRVVAIDARQRQVLSSVRVGRRPFALALSPDGRKLYVTNLGTTQYEAVPETGKSRMDKGLSQSNPPESTSVCVVDVANLSAPKVESFIPAGGSSPAGIIAAAGHVFVANAVDDSIRIINPLTNRVESEIPIRIPGLEQLRGVLPMGLAYHAGSGRLLVAEAGINAVGVIDTRTSRVLGHIPSGWFPTSVAVHQDTVFVANARGHGAGPTAGPRMLPPEHLRQGTISIFPMPAAAELDAHTATVMEANGFRPRPAEPRPLPAAIKHVVLIVKEDRSYDEVMGDLENASNGPARGSADLARFGPNGFANGRGSRLSIKNANTAPNHRSIATRWAFSDNFYADPDAWGQFSLGQSGEQPGGGAIWDHFERHGVSFLNFGAGLDLGGHMPDLLLRNTSREYPGFDMSIADQVRASKFIEEIDSKYVKADMDLPQFLLIHLPNDHMAEARPSDGYPYEESFVGDNDYALGRILEYLSGTKWWNEMAVFVTEDEGGVDHIDAHRTLLYAAGPWAKRNYVSHVNSSFPGLLKTIFRLLKIPPMNLSDAAAADLSDCFGQESDSAGYKALQVDARIFEPAEARK